MALRAADSGSSNYALCWTLEGWIVAARQHATMHMQRHGVYLVAVQVSRSAVARGPCPFLHSTSRRRLSVGQQQMARAVFSSLMSRVRQPKILVRGLNAQHTAEPPGLRPIFSGA